MKIVDGPWKQTRMIPMPMRELDELDARQVRAQPLHISLPRLLLGTGVEQDRVLDVSFRGCLYETEDKNVKKTSPGL